MRVKRKKKDDRARRAGLLAVAAALAAGIAGVLGRRRGSGSGGGGSSAQRLAGRFRRDKRPRYTCECGQAYRVTGVDRHRVYWPEGAERTEPVLGDACVKCERPLPVGHDTAVTA